MNRHLPGRLLTLLATFPLAVSTAGAAVTQAAPDAQASPGFEMHLALQAADGSALAPVRSR